jgi:hypothetical protein
VTALAVAALVVAIVAAAVEPNRSQWPAGVGLPAVEPDGTRTFSIHPGDDVILRPGAARPGDVIVCEGKGDVTVAPPGSAVGSPSGIEASTDRRGVVRVTCEPGLTSEL